MRGRKAPIEIVCEDAVHADLSDGTVYCMFNADFHEGKSINIFGSP